LGEHTLGGVRRDKLTVGEPINRTPLHARIVEAKPGIA
jgi:hypothetical protein